MVSICPGGWDPLYLWNGTYDSSGSGTTLALHIFFGQRDQGGISWEERCYSEVTGKTVYVQWDEVPMTLADPFYTICVDTDGFTPTGGTRVLHDNSYRWMAPHWYDADDRPDPNDDLVIPWPWCWTPGYYDPSSGHYDRYSGLRLGDIATDYDNYVLHADRVDDRERYDVPNCTPPKAALENP